MAEQQGASEQFEILVKRIKDIRIAMMTTVRHDGSLRSRPMATQEDPRDGVLWFFTLDDTPKTSEIERERHINLAYAEPDDQRYVSIAGIATIVRDRAKMQELWSPLYKAWFPDGLEDPNLALLRVTPEYAQYWEGPSLVGMAFEYARALATGQRFEGGDSRKLEFYSGEQKS
jgi:general stress protein 26